MLASHTQASTVNLVSTQRSTCYCWIIDAANTNTCLSWKLQEPWHVAGSDQGVVARGLTPTSNMQPANSWVSCWHHYFLYHSGRYANDRWRGMRTLKTHTQQCTDTVHIEISTHTHTHTCRHMCTHASTHTGTARTHTHTHTFSVCTNILFHTHKSGNRS